MFAAELTRQPVGCFLLAGQNRLVHQVITKDGRTVGTHLGDGCPEVGLGFPAVGFAQFVVPRRDFLFVVATQPGEVEIQPGLLRQANQPLELRECLGVGLVWGVHETAQLQVDADDIGIQRLHL